MTSDVMAELVKFNSQTAGRDRFFRLVQYSSKFIGWMLEKNSSGKEVSVKLRNLEYTLATTRKLLRFGRGVDAIYGALGALSIEDVTLRSTVTLSRINFALYLFSDHLSWLGTAGLLDVNKSKWVQLSNKFWLYSIVMNLLRDLSEVSRILGNSSIGDCLHITTNGLSQTLQILVRTLLRLLAQHKDVAVDTVKNGCDFWIPYTALGYSNCSSGLIGLLGIISSIAAIVQIVDSTFKLVPS